jgi:hypothetical protein
MIEIISYKDIPEALLVGTGKENFSLYPTPFNGVFFHRQRWASIDETKTIFFSATANGKIAAVLEFNLSDYDSQLLAVKAGSIPYIFTNPELEAGQREKLWQELINYFQAYRKKEKINFCFISVNNWEADLSLVLQQAGFKYILTWGKCFVQQPSGLILPEGYVVKKIKREQDLPLILKMADNYFKGGRFYLDPLIGTDKADRLYKDLINNGFSSSSVDFIVLYNQEEIPVGCFITRMIKYDVGSILNIRSLRLLVFDKDKAAKGVATSFLSATSDLLLRDVPLIESGIEMHNLPSFKIHANAGYKMNNVFSAYHSWL